MLGHLGAISLKNLTKRKEIRKGADQAKANKATRKIIDFFVDNIKNYQL